VIRTRTRLAVLSFAAATVPVALPLSAYAGPPATHACIGKSVSAAATSTTAFGLFVSGIAHDPDAGFRLGIGDDVNAVAAGLVPDEDFPNSCNH
jgi:hypothetical protein